MRFIFYSFLFLLAMPALSQEKQEIKGQVDKGLLPKPTEENQLFYLQRDPDINTIVYTLNLKDGELNRSNPVLAYWIRYADKGQAEKLTFIQRKMAYGISHQEIAPDTYELHVHAYKNLKIKLTKNKKTGNYHALVTVNNRTIVLKRIFVRIDGGSIFKPNVQYIEVCGNYLDTGKEVNYRFDF